MIRRSNPFAHLVPRVSSALLACALPLAAQQPLERSAVPPRPAIELPPAPSAAELAAPPATAAKLPSGVATLQLRPGQGKETPRLQDLVHFRSIGRRPDGTVVQNTFASPSPQKLLVTKLIPVWREAILGMVPGEQRRFWFPAALAPKNPESGAQEPIVFDVELVGIGRMPDPPKFVRTPDPQARRTPGGTSILTLKPGDPKMTVKRTDAALVDFTIWNEAGQPLHSSIADTRPTLFPLSRVMSSFADCLEGSAKGEVRLCWIPAERNEGFPGATRGALVFQIELLNVTDAAKLFSTGETPPKRP